MLVISPKRLSNTTCKIKINPICMYGMELKPVGMGISQFVYGIGMKPVEWEPGNVCVVLE